ncbi:sulfatase [Horticoccus sp. 23ND18S-11]|uniref:sulfatase n=1 Tax=Horticoccus sp. 23ND18S-11 TaxID=3391832 RepID=UPI0039C8F4B8
MPVRSCFRVLLICAGLVVTSVTGLAATAATVAKPNILLILADDLGTPPVAAYGNPYYQTPAIDRLARDGVRFTDAYAACPVCSPTRSALMTGKYPARTHVTDFIAGGNFPHARLTQPDWQKFLPLAEKTIAEELSARGYATAMFGKWHLARGYLPPQSVEEGPDRQGFAETFITHKPKSSDDPEKDAHGVEAITTRAIDFIERHRRQPFFLELSHNSIHAPIMAPKALVEKHRARPGGDRPENNPIIAAMMEVLDEGIGRVLAKLDALGLRETTLVIFYSDNGGLLADAAQTPWRGGKAQLYEGGIRVPLVMRWPGVIAPGRTSAVPVTSVDFFPTFLELSGTPAARDAVIDGASLVSVIRGGAEPKRDAIFWHYPHYHAAGIHGPAGAIRAGDWKLIEYYETTLTGQGAATELFDLRNDPAETNNLAAADPKRVARLIEQLRSWRTSVGAQMPTINAQYDPVRAKQKPGGAKD